MCNTGVKTLNRFKIVIFVSWKTIDKQFVSLLELAITLTSFAVEMSQTERIFFNNIDV